MSRFKEKKTPFLLVTYAILLFFGMYYIKNVWQWLVMFLHILTPFILGGCIAFILNIPMTAIEKGLHRLLLQKRRKKWIRPISLILTIAIFIGVIVAIMFLVIPEMIKTFQNIGTAFPGFLERTQNWVRTLPFDWEGVRLNIIDQMPDMNDIGNYLVDFAQNSLGGMLSSVAGVVFSVGQGILNVVIGVIFAIYILVSKEKLGNQMNLIVQAFLKEKRAKEVCRVAALIQNTFSSFVTGQCLEALILGTMFFVTLSILRLPYALLISCVVAVMALVPIVGAFVGCILGAFLILIVDPVQAFIFVIVFLILQQIEGNLIYPHVVGSSVGLPSIWVLVAVTLGGSLFGIVGILVFIPIVSVLYALFREKVVKRLKAKKEKTT